MRKRKHIPRWKRIILTERDWPTSLSLPLNVDCPAGAGRILIGSDEGGSWDWDLIRGPSGKCYYLKACRVGFPADPLAKAVCLTPAEALDFAIVQCINPQLIKDVKREEDHQTRSSRRI